MMRPSSVAYWVHISEGDTDVDAIDCLRASVSLWVLRGLKPVSTVGSVIVASGTKLAEPNALNETIAKKLSAI